MTDNALQKIEPMPTSPSVEGMITLAIEKGASVDTLERLMAIRREVRAEQAKEAYDRALASFQAECPTIRKTAKVMNKDGRSVRYQYAPLDAIISQVKELLQKHGFSYNVNAQAMASSVKATCKFTHAYGHSESSEFEVPIDKDAYMNPAQQVASALTFAKRYAFCNAAGIMTGDADDDSQASFEDKGKPKQPASKPVTSTPQGTSPPKPTAKPPAPAQATTQVTTKEYDPPKPIGHTKPVVQSLQATDKTRAWFLAEMRKRFKDLDILQWACDDGPPYRLTPNESLEDWPLEHVPTSKPALQAEIDRCSGFLGIEPQTSTWPASKEPELEDGAAPSSPERRRSDDGDLGPQTDPEAPEPVLEDGVETVTGKLEQVSTKEGRSAKGPWKRYGLKVGDLWISTFDTLLGEIAKKDKGHACTIQFRRTEKGCDLVSIDRAKSD